MIYAVSVYDKDGKLKETISSKTLLKDHWKKFDKIEGRPKKFVVARIRADQQELLRNYHKMNTIFDELYSKDNSDG